MNPFHLWAHRWKHDSEYIIWKSPGETFIWNAETGYVLVDGIVAGIVYGLSAAQEFCWDILQTQLKKLPLS